MYNTYSVPVPDGSFMNTDNSVTTTAVMQRVMGIISDTICCAPHFNISRLLAVRSSSLISSESSSCSSKDGNRLRHFLNSHTIPHEVSSSEPWLRLLLGLVSVFLVSLKGNMTSMFILIKLLLNCCMHTVPYTMKLLRKETSVVLLHIF